MSTLISFHWRTKGADNLQDKKRPKNPLLRLILVLCCITFVSMVNIAIFHSIYSQSTEASSLRKTQTSFMGLPEVLPTEKLQPTQGSRHKHAYAFLMAGCNPSIPSYMGYVYNILVAAHILHISGSTSDIVVLVRMATNSDQSALPSDVEALLKASGVILRYLPKVKVDNFYTAMMAKFYILNLVEYSRVLFLDSDIFPLCNLDYIFNFSEGENALLRENVVLAWRTEPANGGFFMLQPDRDDYIKILDIQRRRNRQGSKFDIVNGWGHAIQPPDQWVSRNGIKRGTNWTFYGAMADQGLLYHWVKYVKKSVSIINQDKVETWGTDNNTVSGPVRMIKMHSNIFHDGCSSSMPQYKINWGRNFYPEKDFVHFTGSEKPWLNTNIQVTLANKSQVVFDSADVFWYHILEKVLAENNITMVKNIPEPNLGGFPEDYMVEYLQQEESILQ
jgi:hypothetical protein